MAPLLSKALKDDAWPVRRSAAFALGCLDTGAAAAQDSLETALRDTSPEVRQNAAWSGARRVSRMFDGIAIEAARRKPNVKGAAHVLLPVR